MVRGFWGDIINSPFVPLGADVVDAEDRSNFFKQVNYQRLYVISFSYQ